MPYRPDLETHLLRKELVRAYHHQGLSVTDMLRRLDGNGLFSPTQRYNARYSLVARLLRSTQKEDAKRYRVLQDEAGRALVEYIGRQSFLYQKAVEDGNWALARDLSKDIARAHGVPTEEPIRVETDLLSQLQAAFQVGMKKVTEERRRIAESSKETPKAIEIMPPSLSGNGKEESKNEC